MTEWRRISWAPDYEVSDDGQVRSWKTWRGQPGPRILRQTVGNRGYYLVSVVRRKMHNVHQLVAEAFLGPRPDGMVVRHLDGNELNNRLDNLAYGTPSENEYDKIRHGTHPTASKTHCPQDHPYDDENTYLWRGHRICRACSRKRQERRRAAA